MPEGLRHLSLAVLAEVRDDREGVKEHLSGVQPWWRLLLQIRVGLPLDPVEVAALPQANQQLLEGELALRRQDWRAAIDLLRPAVEWSRLLAHRPTFARESESLATALHETGDDREALRVLEKAVQEVVTYHGGGRIYEAFDRSRVQARLAREYRKVGRIDEAVAIEDEVLHMLKYADADHPIVLQIKETRAEAGSLTDG